MKVKDVLKELEGLDPETELTIVPQKSYVLTPVVKDDVLEKGSEE